MERLGLLDEEIKVKVVDQFLMNDAKMWWQRRMDQITSGSAYDITSCDDINRAL